MALNFLDLDEKTRLHMATEINYDKQSDNFHRSNYLSEHGKTLWASLLEESVQHDDVWLENEIQVRGMLAQFYTKRKPKSTELMQAKVPVTGAQTLAEGEFNRLYARGLCSAVLSEGGEFVEAYRARESANPRQESEAIIGSRFFAQAVLDDLRASQGVDSALGIPRPNSGISIKRVK